MMDRSALHLVACVKVKRPEPMAARDLYCSDWFAKARRYVEQRSDRWYILSAKYGLVHPDKVRGVVPMAGLAFGDQKSFLASTVRSTR